MFRRRMALWCWTLTVTLLVPVFGVAQAAGKPAHDPILGRWKLDARKSRARDPKDRLASMTRYYSFDGDKIKVWWDGRLMNGKQNSGSYSYACDGTLQPAYGNAQIRCEYANRNWINGEIVDENDPQHRYFSQVVAPDAKSMKILWFGDAERKQLRDVMLFDKIEARKKK